MSYAGQLLVAAPALKDPNFERAVVLLLAHGPDGAIGVILNRISQLPVATVLPGWDDAAASPAVVFEGGPVQPDSAICLARVRQGTDPEHWSRVVERLGTADISVEPEQLLPQVEMLRVFAGYSGWASGQLEGEIERGGWLVLDLLPSDPFTDRSDDLWPMVLRRQPGLLSAVAHFPPDPSLN